MIAIARKTGKRPRAPTLEYLVASYPHPSAVQYAALPDEAKKLIGSPSFDWLWTYRLPDGIAITVVTGRNAFGKYEALVHDEQHPEQFDTAAECAAFILRKARERQKG